MTRSILASALGSQFDAFLFAPIGKDTNDTPLSVLSVLARLGIDPWQEAAELAGLPQETATHRLASSIAALPGMPLAHLENGTIAGRLVALLPRQGSFEGRSSGMPVNVDVVTKARTGLYLYVVLIAFMLISQWIVASVQPTPVGGTNSAVAPAPTGQQAAPQKTNGAAAAQ